MLVSCVPVEPTDLSAFRGPPLLLVIFESIGSISAVVLPCDFMEEYYTPLTKF